MQNINIKLYFDRYSLDDSDFEKWTAFVEKYVLFCLKQKEVSVDLAAGLSSEINTSKSCLIYIPVFSQKTLASAEYLERVSIHYSQRQQKGVRLFGLIKDSVVTEKVYTLFPELKLLKMFLVDSDTGHDVSDKNLWKKETMDQFLFKIYDLCSEVEREVKPFIETETSQTKKAIYIADPSPDVIPIRDEIRRELIKMGFEVIPSKPVSGATKEKEKIISDYLHKTSLSVHIFGKLPHEAKPGEMSTAELENKVAANYYTTKIETKKVKTPFSRIIWLPDNLVVLDEVQSKFLRELQRDKKLYSGADIIRSSVEELKDIILEKLQEQQDAVVTRGEVRNRIISIPPPLENQKIVYVINSEKNRDGATAVKRILETVGYEVLVDDGSEVRETESIRKCNSVLFYYMNEDPSWLRSKMSEVFKFRTPSNEGKFLKRGVISYENQEIPSDDIFKEVVQFKAGQQIEEDQFLSFFQKAF